MSVEPGASDGPVVAGVEARPIAEDDGDRLIRFHEALDATSQYQRFFTLHPHLSASEVERFTHVDHLGRQALVATWEQEIVAAGRSEQLDAEPSTAEVAFIVAPAWREQGLATALLHQLADLARTRGITTFVAEVLSNNAPMRDVFHDAGFPVTSRLVDGSDEIRMDITLADVPTEPLGPGGHSGPSAPPKT